MNVLRKLNLKMDLFLPTNFTFFDLRKILRNFSHKKNLRKSDYNQISAEIVFCIEKNAMYALLK